MKQKFGAGIWHFATYVDRYNTEGYGEPRSVLDAINLAGQVNDLSFVDINYPYFGGSFSNQQIKDELDKVNLEVIGITPEIYTKEFRKGAFTNPDPGIRNKAHELITEACEAVRFLMQHMLNYGLVKMDGIILFKLIMELYGKILWME